MSADQHGTVRLERSADGRSATLTFVSGQPANVLTRPVLDDLLASVAEVEGDAGLRVLVLRGAPGVFSGGADLDLVRRMSRADFSAYVACEYELFRRVERLALITVAAVEGACIGNGAELALACDFRVVSADARLGLPEVRVGFAAPLQRLSQYVGVGVAKELLYTGRLLRADEARAHGLVTVVADGDLDAALAREVDRWSQVAPVALRMTKAAIDRCYAGADHDGPERDAAVAGFATDDFAEGAAAALAGRRPEFRGH